MKRSFLISVVFMLSNAGFSQYASTIRTGRPGQAIGPFAVGKYVFQTQTGFDFGGYLNESPDFSGQFYHPNTVLRFGLTDKFELNTAWGFQHEKVQLASDAFSLNGVNTATVGARFNICEARNYKPAIGVQLSFKLPVPTADYKITFLAPKILLISRFKLTNTLTLFTNIGVNYNGITPNPEGNYVLNLSYSINDKWGVFIENYGDFKQGVFNTYLDTGLSFLVNPDFQVDLYGGAGKNNNRFSYFSSIGISWRYVQWYQKNKSE